MDFMKKNWAKCIIKVLTFLAGLFYLIALIQAPGTASIFKGHALAIAGILFFWGVTAYLICKMLNQDWAKWVLLCTGILGTVFAMASLIHVADIYSNITAIPTFTWFAPQFAFLVIFGLIPLVKGIAKVCCTGEKKKAPTKTTTATAK